MEAERRAFEYDKGRFWEKKQLYLHKIKEYRVGLCKDGMRLTECFDLMLTRYSDRRLLEQYVASKRQELPNLGNVWFGKPNWCGHYKLPDYIRKTYGNEYLNDMNI